MAVVVEVVVFLVEINDVGTDGDGGGGGGGGGK